MSISFKQFASMVLEGKTAYSSQSYWEGDAEGAGYKIRKLSGDVSSGDQTWGAFNEKDEKMGEFTEKEGGWLVEGAVNEVFGMFRSADKAARARADRDDLKKKTNDLVQTHRERQEAARMAKENGRGRGKDADPDGEEEDDKKKKTTAQTRSASTRGTRSTQSQAAGRHAERDWLKNMD